MKKRTYHIYPEIEAFIEKELLNFDQIPADRKADLSKIGAYILENKGVASLLFVCTHNSRRSTLAQVWAIVAARYFGWNKIETFSGGTEVTAFNEHAIQALESVGFVRTTEPHPSNPKHTLKFAEEGPGAFCFSKKYDYAHNPNAHFAAIMTCGHADENCPFIPGADIRVPITYIDPKVSDGSGNEQKVYGERSTQIGQEMFYLFHTISQG